MIDGNPNEFLDTMLWNDQMLFSYKDVVYCYNGKKVSDNAYNMEIFEKDTKDSSFLWQYKGEKCDDGLKDFLHSPIFDNKTFSEVEQEITWIK